MGKNQFLYMQLYDDLKSKISEGIFREGEKLPSDDELRSQYKVSLITVKKALTMLKEEGYVRRVPGVGSFAGRQISAGRSERIPEQMPVEARKKIGLVLEHVTSAFGLDLVYQLDRRLSDLGYKLLIRFSYYSREKETEEIEFLIESGVQAMVIMPCHGVYYNPAIVKLILEGFPVVMIDKKLEGISVPSVRTDNKGAVSALVEEMSIHGCRHMAFLSTEIIGTSSLQDRRIGFHEEVEKLGYEPMEDCVVEFSRDLAEHGADEAATAAIAKYLLANAELLDGIVCAEYTLLSSIEAAARQTGTDIYHKIRISCIDGPDEFRGLYMKQDEISMANQIIGLLSCELKAETHLPGEETADIIVPAIMVRQE